MSPITTTKHWSTIADLEKRFGVMTLGGFIKAFREAEDQNQSQYAKKIGLSRANLCDIESERKVVTPMRAARIAKKMGIAEEVLMQLTIQDALRRVRLHFKVELRRA